MLCRKCGILIGDESNQTGYHQLCTPVGETPVYGMFQRSTDPSGMSHMEIDIRDELTEMIQWGSKNIERNGQIAVGPSELGTPCDRELAYRIAGIQGKHESDPLPSIIGTASHTWMDSTVQAFEKTHGLKRYQTEMKVAPDIALSGHTDLYKEELGLVLDWKFPGTEPMKKLRTEGFGDRYRTQLNLYGLGHIRAGRPVKYVGIAALCRGGWLKDMWVKIEPYDEQIAKDAIQRMYNLGDLIDKEDLLDDPSRWDRINASPSRMCGYCRMYRTGGPADGTGCPGR